MRSRPLNPSGSARWARRAVVIGTALGLAAATGFAAGAESLSTAIAARDWRRGAALCDGLAASEAARANRKDMPAAHYAILATRCAAVAGGAADPAGVDWWWYTAIAMDPKSALSELDVLRAAGVSIPVPGPRALAPNRAASPGSERVRLADGRSVAGTPAQLIAPEPPKYLREAAPVGAAPEIGVEVIVSADGVPRDPVLRSAMRARPVHAFLALRYLREWRFFPALVGGAPVASVPDSLIVTFSSGKP